MRPLLLLDVDGVLMPIGCSVPQGYARHRTAEHDVVARRSSPTLLIRTSAAVGLTEEQVERLRAFGDR
jgi:hypothetical protein